MLDTLTGSKFVMTMLAMVGVFVGWYMGKDVAALAIVLPAIITPYLAANVIQDLNRRKHGEYRDGTN